MSKSRIAQNVPVSKPAQWGKPTKPRQLPEPWYGLDTERDAKRGDFVCGFAVNETDCQEFQRLDELRPGTYWVWNLPYDIEGMIRDYDDETGWGLRSDASVVQFQDATCRYFHGKKFTWKDKRGMRTFLEASSFYGRAGLNTIASKVLGETKKAGVDASQMSLDRYMSDPIYKYLVDDYCKQDALLALRLIRRLDDGFRAIADKLEVNATIGTTPGATARRFLAKLGPYPPILWQTHKPFLRVYAGGRFELTKLGSLRDVYQYDITSAYPYALSRCPWLTETATRRFARRVSDDALFGAYQVSFKTDEYLGLAPAWRGPTRVYSKAENEVWLTKLEVDWLQNNGYDYKIHQGTEIFDENATSAWRDLMVPAFSLKEDNPGSDLALGAKGMLVSVYGVLIQLTPYAGKWVPMGQAENPVDFIEGWELEAGPSGYEAGQAYAPVYASYSTAHARLQLLDAARSLGDAYIGGHTDSVLTTKPLKQGVGKGLGKWVLETKADDFVITKTGVYAMDSKVKNRGIGKVRDRRALWTPTQQRKTRTSLKSAKSWDEVSLIRAKPVANNLKVDEKRAWLGHFDASVIEAGRYVDSEALQYVGTWK